MKRTILFSLLLASMLLIACSVAKQSPKTTESKDNSQTKAPTNLTKKIDFTFPDDSLIMSESAKAEFVANIEKGEIIYSLLCAKCHNKLVNGVEVVPDFSLPQLMDYEMRIQYPSHKDRLTETNLSVKELDQVVDYLRYKKKTGVHF